LCLIFIGVKLYTTNTMKLTKEQKQLFVKSHGKWLSESLFGKALGRLFTIAVKKNLNKDGDFMKSLKDADNELTALRDYVKKTEKEGRPVPSYIKKYL